jgi:dihydroorotate dehydrogenase
MYNLLFSLVLKRLPAETAHRWAFGLIRLVGAIPGAAPLLRRWLGPTDPVLRVHTLGLDLAGPLGLAAGFDKDAVGVEALTALGFAYVEVGTVTAQPQPGNPAPRMFRLLTDRALVNRMGFNNHGAAAAAQRLRKLRDRRRTRRHGEPGRRPAGGIGVNIGKSKVVPEADALADYVSSARILADVADFLVVNVSSPNTPGLRNLQAIEHLRPLVVGVREALDEATTRRVPLLVKIAPDLADADVDAVADLALELGLDGIIATNTTISREGLQTPSAVVEEIGPGGLSGPPLKNRALEVLRRLRARTGPRVVLIAVGGIENAADAWERITAGASLVQAYTGFIYGGPLWPRRLHRDLARLVREAGYSSTNDAVGTAGPPEPSVPTRSPRR